MAQNLLAGRGAYFGDVAAGKSVLLLQVLQQAHRRVGRNVRGVAFHANAERLPTGAEPVKQLLHFRTAGESLEYAELAFQDRVRPGESAFRQACRQHTALGSATGMETFHHAAISGLAESE